MNDYGNGADASQGANTQKILLRNRKLHNRMSSAQFVSNSQGNLQYFG